MGEKVERVKLEVKTEDESSRPLEEMTRRLEEFVGAGKKAGRLIKEGAGVGLAVEIADRVGEAMSANAERVQKFAEEYEHANDTVAKSAALTNFTESLPGVGKLVKGYRELHEAIDDLHAAYLKQQGATEEEVDAARSITGLQSHYTEVLKHQGEAIDSLRESTEALALARAKLAGGPEAEGLEAEAASNARIKKLRDELFKLQHDAGDNPTGAERQGIAAKRLEILQERQRFEADEAKRHKDLNQERETDEGEHVGRLQRIRDEAAEAWAKGIESDSQAEADAITRRADREMAEAIRADESRKKGKDPRQQAEIDRQTNEETAAIQERLVAEQQAFAARSQREAEAAEQEHQGKLARIRGEAAVEALRNERHEDEAALLELKNRHEEELAEIDRANADKLQRLRNSPGGQGQLEALERQIAQQKAALDAKYGVDVDSAKRQQANRHEDEADQAANELAEARVGLLHAAGEAGNKLAEQDAQRLEIMTRTEAKIAAINRQLREQKDLSPEARADLEKTIGLLRQSEALSLGALVHDAATADGEYRAAPGGEQGRGMTGLAAAMAVRMHNNAYRQEQAQLRQLGLTETIAALTAQIRDLVAQQGGRPLQPQQRAFHW